MDMRHKNIEEMERLLRFLRQERAKVPNFPAFRARLRNYGYCIRRDSDAHFLHLLPSREKICPVPQELFG